MICSVATKIGRYFLNLIDNHFPRDHKFHKTFNRNNTKVSYSCIPNIKSPINSHNRKVHLPLINSQSRTCNCIKKTDCRYKRNAWVKIHYIKQILVRKTLKQKSITAYQKQNLKQYIQTIKSPSTTKSTKMTLNCRMNSGKLKLQKKSQS